MQVHPSLPIALTLSLVVAGCSKKEASSEGKPSATTSTKAVASAASIPSQPVSGKLGEQGFTLKKASMVTAKGFGEWRLTLEGTTSGGETAAIRLPIRSALAAGKSIDVGAASLTPGAKVAGVSVQSGTKSTTSSNASYRIEITKWDVKPCPADGEPTHPGGYASGKIRVVVPGENVEVAGTFEDAAVTYGATPDWDYR
jgi:hypothetical protein